MKKNKVVIVSLIIVLFLSLGFLYVGWNKYQSDTKNKQEDLAKIGASVPVDWKIFKDGKGVFEFKYPSQWIFKNNNDDVISKRGQSPYDSYLSVKTPDYVSGEKPGNVTGAMFLLTGMRQKNMQGVEIPIKDCENYPGLKLVDCPDKTSIGSIMKVGDIVAFKESKNNVTGVSFIQNGVSYSLSLLRSNNFEGGDDVFYQILSTLKFTK